jgi:branched-chain amino acid transport system permease protein
MKRSDLQIVALLLSGTLLFAFYNSSGNFSTFGITVLSGLFQGMLLFLIAAGLSLVFGLMDVLNFAQGAYFMVGAYLAYDIQHTGGVIDVNIPDPGLRFIVGVIVATLAGGILGVILELLLRPLYKRHLFVLVLTFGVSVIMLEGIKKFYSVTPYTWTDYFGIRAASFNFFGQEFGQYRPFVILVGLVLMVGISLLLRKTRIGIIIRAGVQDPEMVSALGINVRSVFTMVFTLGCAVAAFGGAISAPFLGATMTMGSTYLVAAIAVIVLGGLGSYEGTAIGAILVGLTMSAMQQFGIQTNQPVLASITPMLLLVLVLLIRPRGLFGEER